MAKSQVLDYYINLHDADLVAQIQAQIDAGNPLQPGPYTDALLNLPGGGWAIWMAPDTAATYFATLMSVPPFPVWNVEDSPVPSAGGYIDGPNLYQNNRYPKDQRFFEKDGGWWIFGSDTKFYWAGHVRYVPLPGATAPSATDEPTELCAIPARHVLVSGAQGETQDSFFNTVSEQVAAASLDVARCASRLGGGFGLQMTKDSAGAMEVAFNHQSTPRSRWERFNFMAPFAPNVITDIWRGQNASVGGTGFALAITPSLQVALLNYSAPSTSTLVGTFGSALTPGKFYKFDVLFDVDAANDLITIDVLMNGVLLTTSTRAAGGVMGVRFFTRSGIGSSQSISTSARFCFSDYIISDVPKSRDRSIPVWSAVTAYVTNDYVRTGAGFVYRAVGASTGKVPGQPDTPGGSVYSYWIKQEDSIDFQVGSHIQRVGPRAHSANHGAWTGDVRLVKQKGGSTTLLNNSSTTSGAVYATTTNLERDVESIPGNLGWVAAQVNLYSLRGGAPSGSIGYQLSTGGAQDTAFTQSVTMAWFCKVANLPAATTAPRAPGETLELRHTKAADGTTGRVSCLHAFVEVIGRFSDSDDAAEDASSVTIPTTLVDDPQPNGLHNCQFPTSPWYRQRDALAPVIVRGGTYVGTGVNSGVTLSFPLPPIFIFVRPVTGIATPHTMWPQLMENHDGHAQGGDYSTRITAWEQDVTFVQADPDADQQLSFDVHIGTSDASLNTAAATYQYVAFMDPAARFSRGGVFNGADNNAPLIIPMDDSEFTAEVFMAWLEQSGTTTTSGYYMTGPGLTAGQMNSLSLGTSLASAITLGAGQLTVGSSWFSTTFAQYGYLGFRKADGNNHPDQAKVMFHGTYTGDGSASRTIGLTPASGCRPLFAIVIPNANVAIYRDPSHTTNTSTAFNSAVTTATGITAGGIDSFTVGSTLNSNGVVYTYFGFYANATAGNGGWGTNGEYIQVPADSPHPSDWTEPEGFDPDVPDPNTPNPLDPGDLDTDIAADCIASSTRICNQALSECGITVQLTNLATDTSQEAYTCRMHYRTIVEEVLRAYPWLFARRLTTAGLTLLDGAFDAPVNADWTYSYALPSDCLRVLRIVDVDSGRRRRDNHTPIAFTQTQDDTPANILLTNEPEEFLEEGDPLNIEYIRRVPCPGRVTDAEFRMCLVYRLASAICKPLGKDAKDADALLLKYKAHIPQVKVHHANDQERQRPTDTDPDWITGR